MQKAFIDELFSSIQGADIDIRNDLFKHIVLSGGTTMYPGFPTRIEEDLKKLILKNVLQGDSSRQSVRIILIFYIFSYLHLSICSNIACKSQN